MSMALFHLSLFVLNAYTIWYDQVFVDFPFRKEILEHNLPFNNRILFLTMWCLVVQTFYFGIAFLNDMFGTNANTKRTPVIRVTKDTLFSLAFTLASYVSLTFWIIYHTDKELIFPIEVEEAIPWWANHVMHTLIAPFMILELLLSNRNYPTKKVGIAMVILFTTSYLFVLYLCYVKTGTWVYPLLDVLNWPMRIVFFVISILFGIAFYIVGEKLNSLVSSSPSIEVNGKKKR